MAQRLADEAERVEPANFGAWMAGEQRRVFQICLRLLDDRDEADSAAQDTFLKAWRALRRRQPAEPDDASRWVMRIAVNTCLDRLRSRRWQFWRRRPRPADEDAILAMSASPEPAADRRVFSSEIKTRLQAALSQLSLRQRAVFTLRHYEDMSLEEIGLTLGLETGTVKAHLFRALSKLRAELGDLDGWKP